MNDNERYTDFPFDDVCKKALELINSAPGKIDVYQKYTCSGCGQRLTMDKPNTFYETGSCDKCDTITNIKEKGCNMMVHARSR